ncbi:MULTISPECIES: ArsR/SmtB family transcription factor [Burkholderia]|uniref:ArsR family transcriptional regulator n=1 Tax=Burkholderia anthina TaxID=179879 RepID=A0A6P2G5B1_9BURK|nr:MULTISPECIES: metalloregulator ArsR/SmtB family transcription factor [Burkholderia]AXK63574.1 transcriptional regulator [Burkholderia sp. IDO3]MBM2765746.1 helix-turn-helix transcriptional regulator [Burkholderia anthina]PCD59548.1 ArsR family transcriptional regulator [Burkholderia sp. IDO3]QTD92815.1 helix-turn-helix transcriptional regulator [Burkholderia anthina]VVU48311.1 ArsR family transcriptional regulator [Burkholderia anthina]
MANFQPGIDDVFHALADPTRCAIVSALGGGGRTVSELAAPFDMALPSFMKHVAVLERSGLVQTRKDGRSRTCELVGSRLAEAEQWLAAQRALWEARADRLVEFVERRHQEDSTHVSQPRRPRRNP